MTNDIKALVIILSLILVIDIAHLISKIPYKHTDLGLCFRINYYPFCTCGKICQRRIKMSGATQAQQLAAFATQQHTLENELPPGAYFITTHAAILKRIEACKSISVTQCKKTYKRSLKANYRALVGARNIRNKNFEKVQFYKIKIIKE